MRKTLIISAIIAAFAISAGVGFAAKEKEPKKEPKKESVEKKAPKENPVQENLLREKMDQRRQSGPEDMQRNMQRFQDRYAEEIKNAKEGPESTIRELVAIKEIASKEKATKTVAALEQLIDKTRKQMEQRVKVIEERQAKFREFMEKRGTGPAVPEGALPDGSRPEGLQRKRPPLVKPVPVEPADKN